MGENAVERRLAAILVADTVGFSRLMGRDEVGTLAGLNRLRREIVDPRIGQHKGRIFKTTGDGFFVEFPSVVNAVACAAEIQKAMAARNASPAEDGAMQFRIGVNLGDVIAEGDDIFGDGVNVAARLEAIAPPGGVAISGTVRHHLGDRLALMFEDMGDQKLKNIDIPVRVFRISFSSPNLPVAPAGSSRPALVVLPFVNMSGDPAQDTFADGLTEDIITAVSHASTLLVISRTTAFTLKGMTLDIKRVRQELSVDYVLEGSVRRSGDKVRVTAQLTDAASGHHLWAQKYDGSIADVFSIQDDITRAIATCLNTQVFLTAWQNRKLSPDSRGSAHELAFAAMGRLLDSTRDAYQEGERLADIAIAADPRCHMAHVAKATAVLDLLSHGLVDDFVERSEVALESARRAMSLAPQDEYSRWAYAWALFDRGQMTFSTRLMEEAVAECQRGLDINPNSTILLGDIGSFQTWLGNAREGLSAAELALRLNPRDPGNHWRHATIANASFLLGDYERARNEAQRMALSTKNFARGSLFWIASAAALGNLDEAGMAVRHCLAEFPELRLANIWPRHMPRYARDEDQKLLCSMLDKAGFPQA